jgi:hypothetical protein
MQPAQLSLLPQQFPAPPQIVLAQLPEPDVADVIRLLAYLIAKAATEDEEPGGE